MKAYQNSEKSQQMKAGQLFLILFSSCKKILSFDGLVLILFSGLGDIRRKLAYFVLTLTELRIKNRDLTKFCMKIFL